jgi:hypothetical protein
VEDALGFKFPVPSEYDFGMMENIIRYRFKEGAGAHEVQTGNYELCKTKKRSEVITATSRLLPGTAMIMAILVMTHTSIGIWCPMPQCGRSPASGSPGGGYIWYVTL